MNNHYIYVSAACTPQKQTQLPAENWVDLITSDTAIAQQRVIIFSWKVTLINTSHNSLL
jgi:hypothetical protein